MSKALVKDKLPGSIVNISSIVAKMGNIGQTSYSASKGGVISMTKTCARELSGYARECLYVFVWEVEVEGKYVLCVRVCMFQCVSEVVVTTWPKYVRMLVWITCAIPVTCQSAQLSVLEYCNCAT